MRKHRIENNIKGIKNNRYTFLVVYIAISSATIDDIITVQANIKPIAIDVLLLVLFLSE